MGDPWPGFSRYWEDAQKTGGLKEMDLELWRETGQSVERVTF